MQAPLVVERDPVLDVAAGGGSVWPAFGADFGFDGGEEGFGSRAVEAGSGAAGALSNLQSSECVPVGRGVVLPGFNRSLSDRGNTDF